MQKTTKPIATQDVEHGKTQTISSNETNVQQSPIPDEPENKKKKINEARELLKARSLEVRKLVEEGKFETINDALIETMYNDETHHEFKSYRGWKKEGFQVRKGEKGFLLWGRPTEKKNDKEKPSPDTTHKETKEEHDPFYPLAFAFSDAQVDPITHNRDTQESKTVSDLTNIRNENMELANDMER